MAYSNFASTVKLDVIYHAPSEEVLQADLARALRHAADEIERGETIGDTPRLHWRLAPVDMSRVSLRLKAHR